MRAIRLCALPLLWGLACAAQAAPAPKVVSLTAADGMVLKATYFAAAKPGPGVLLLHQCNQQRKSWDGLAEKIAARGIHVLTLDYRGYGESDGARFVDLPYEERRKIVVGNWPGDFDMAFKYLLAQPGVAQDVAGAGGASCGVNNAIQLARRNPQVKALMLLSGATNREGRMFLQSSKALPVITAAADDDDAGSATDIMQWLFSVSGNSGSRFQRYPAGGHGAEMFAPHPELLDLLADWFAATLFHDPRKLPKTNGVSLSPQVVKSLTAIDQPGAAEALAKKPAESGDPKLVPERFVNLLGYEHLRSEDAKGAVEIFKLNASAHPDSPNVYDSLSDAYLADGQKELALQNAKKALELLARDTSYPEEARKALRDSAEEKVKQLEAGGSK